MALVGANGAGKTTLLNTISGLLRPASGSVEFLGKRIDRLAPHKIVQLGICQIPEGRKLFSRHDSAGKPGDGCIYLGSLEAEERNAGAGLSNFPGTKRKSEAIS